MAPSAATARELMPGLWSLRLPLGWEDIPHVNAYAIARDDGWLLVDCGSWGDESCWDALVDALGKAGIGVRDVRVLAATHCHSDHVGVAERLIKRSGCEFWMHPSHGHFYEPMRAPRAFETARARRATLEGVPGQLIHLYRDVAEEVEGVMAPVEPHHELVTGVRLPSRLGDWEVIEAPGHAPSHVVLHQRERRVLIAGDLVSPSFAPYFDYGYSPDPVGEYIASLRLVGELGEQLTLPGHGRPIDDLGAVIADHRRGVDDRLAATAAALDDGPAGAYETTLRVFSEDASEVLRVWQFVETVCYLRHLRVLGLVHREGDSDGSFRYRTLDPSRWRTSVGGGASDSRRDSPH